MTWCMLEGVLWDVSCPRGMPARSAMDAAARSSIESHHRDSLAVISAVPGQFDSWDECFMAASSQTPRIQEAHLVAWHLVCELVERGIEDAERT